MSTTHEYLWKVNCCNEDIAVFESRHQALAAFLFELLQFMQDDFDHKLEVRCNDEGYIEVAVTFPDPDDTGSYVGYLTLSIIDYYPKKD